VYLRAVRPGGRVEVEAVVERMGASIAFTTAELFDQHGRRCVRCVQTAKLIDMRPRSDGGDGK
jgi:acyl-coenzyme A thioesterase PaaI-like protein